jgi:hypothetical protein
MKGTECTVCPGYLFREGGHYLADKGFFAKAFEGLSRFVLPLAKETHRSVLSNAHEEFLVDMEEEIRHHLGVRNGKAVVRIMRYLFRKWLREGPPEMLDEEEEEEEGEYDPEDPFDGMRVDGHVDPWS